MRTPLFAGPGLLCCSWLLAIPGPEYVRPKRTRQNSKVGRWPTRVGGETLEEIVALKDGGPNGPSRTNCITPLSLARTSLVYASHLAAARSSQLEVRFMELSVLNS